ncbi:thiamine-monophosphate kinase [Paenibacillus sp. J31TS4]|uniref:thiamine-phosphate kinase n=1 Tax=Paenibacillus sp. J31TS4 TaxID=2807195 RepID=UPI001B24769F|nr:thiamine-phosphate kinase [Paenibacillus sp. J31TS4]GIP39988.1 thiamine-monophosphate kinase [Paenibacillus sp. J31TS4]
MGGNTTEGTARMEEFALIRLLKEAGEAAQAGVPRQPGEGESVEATGAGSGVVVGIGDDAAVCEVSPGRQLVLACDTMVETIHFHERTMRPADIGHKAMVSNLSDLAAMGAEPRYALVALSAPASADASWLGQLYEGLYACAARYGAAIVGGDTTASPGGLTITVTVIGEVEPGRALLRSGAQPGDRVFVTGYPGCSAAGLHRLLRSGPASRAEAAGAEPADADAAAADGSPPEGAWAALVRAHRRPEPRVAAGRLLQRSGACRSLNDVSDGVASEAWEIAEASGCRFVLREAAFPVHAELRAYADETGQDPLDWALYGGEDYELLGTAAAGEAERVEALFREAGIPFHYIGETVAGEPGVELLRVDGRREPVGKRGYNHFA